MTVNQTNIRLKAGDTFVVRSRTRLENTNKKSCSTQQHTDITPPIRASLLYRKPEKIKALKSGTCVIYVVANNGVYGTIKVTVN